MLRTLLLSALCLFATAAQAAPTTVTLEGRLFDLLGEPVTGEHTLSFYFFDTGTTNDPTNAIWSDAFDVQLDAGYYSVRLGAEGQQPLDSDEFFMLSGELWFGMAVDNGPVLEPTLPVTESPFAMMAHHVAGRTEDQSPLVLLDEVPLIDELGRFVGAVDASSLAVGGTPIFNSQGDLVAIVDLPAGSTIDGKEIATLEFVTSTAFVDDVSGQTAETNPRNHLRYTDGEAITAVIDAFGIEDDANARNHTRYSDVEAVGAVEDAFGALEDTNPRYHVRYTDDEARAAVDGLYVELGGGVLSGDLVLGTPTSAPSQLAWNTGVDGVEWSLGLDGEDLVLAEGDGGGVIHLRITDGGAVEISPDGTPAILATPSGDVTVTGTLTVENAGLASDALVAMGNAFIGGDLVTSGVVRSACPTGTSALGGWCIDTAAQGPSDLGTSINACVTRGLRLCTADVILSCDLAGAPTLGCAVASDTPGTIVRTGSLAGSNAFQVTGYKGDDTLVVTAPADNLPYFCCASVLPE